MKTILEVSCFYNLQVNDVTTLDFHFILKILQIGKH